MSTLAESKNLLRRYSIARIPFIAINTIERARSLGVLKEVAEELTLPSTTWPPRRSSARTNRSTAPSTS